MRDSCPTLHTGKSFLKIQSSHQVKTLIQVHYLCTILDSDNMQLKKKYPVTYIRITEVICWVLADDWDRGLKDFTFKRFSRCREDVCTLIFPRHIDGFLLKSHPHCQSVHSERMTLYTGLEGRITHLPWMGLKRSVHMCS